MRKFSAAKFAPDQICGHHTYSHFTIPPQYRTNSTPEYVQCNMKPARENVVRIDRQLGSFKYHYTREAITLPALPHPAG